MIFSVEPLRFSFLARESIHFPTGKSSNILRGAFGTIFRSIACVPQCGGARDCERRAECPYARIFEPRAMGDAGPSGFADQPRPFVFRAIHLDGQTFEAGQPFHFDLHLFDTDATNIAYFVLAFARLADEGLGTGRRKVELVSVSRLNERAEASAILYAGGTLNKDADARPLALDLTPGPEIVSRVRVKFLTPTELKGGPLNALQPEFGILAARARDRISLLREFYGEGPLDIDFRASGERAAMVKMIDAQIETVAIQRKSSRTGQVHSIGGFVGEAEYEGELQEFVPYLKAAKWTGVGRQTVWGKGEIDVFYC